MRSKFIKLFYLLWVLSGRKGGFCEMLLTLGRVWCKMDGGEDEDKTFIIYVGRGLQNNDGFIRLDWDRAYVNFPYSPFKILHCNICYGGRERRFGTWEKGWYFLLLEKMLQGLYWELCECSGKNILRGVDLWGVKVGRKNAL